MIRFIFYIVLTYVIYFILKIILNFFRKRPPTNPPQPPNPPVNKEVQTIDKSKIVDADFEEIK